MGMLKRQKLLNDIETIIGPSTAIHNYNDRNLFRLWLYYMKGKDASFIIPPLIKGAK